MRMRERVDEILVMTTLLSQSVIPDYGIAELNSPPRWIFESGLLENTT